MLHEMSIEELKDELEILNVSRAMSVAEHRVYGDEEYLDAARRATHRINRINLILHRMEKSNA